MGILGPTFFAGNEEAPSDGVFHYTNKQALTKILRDGVLRPHRTMPGDRCALVWFSTNGIWEPAAGRGLPWNRVGEPMAFDVLAQRGLGRILVEKDAAPLRWPQLRTLVSPQWLALTQGPAGQWVRANCHRWYGSRQPVHRESWLSIEVWHAPRWRELAYSWTA